MAWGFSVNEGEDFELIAIRAFQRFHELLEATPGGQMRFEVEEVDLGVQKEELLTATAEECGRCARELRRLIVDGAADESWEKWAAFLERGSEGGGIWGA